MYNDKTCKFLYPKFVLGQYLVPEIVVGSTMTANTLRKNGEVIPRSTLWHLTLEDMENLELKEQCRTFYEDVIANLGDPPTETDLPAKYLTPTYDAYINDN